MVEFHMLHYEIPRLSLHWHFCLSSMNKKIILKTIAGYLLRIIIAHGFGKDCQLELHISKKDCQLEQNISKIGLPTRVIDFKEGLPTRAQYFG